MNSGHKRLLSKFYHQLEEEGYKVQQLKDEIDDLIVKTIISAQPHLKHEYSMCQPNNYENS